MAKAVFDLIVFFGCVLLITRASSHSTARSKRNWRALANCLSLGKQGPRNVSSEDILRFIHRQKFMIVPPSNPPTREQIREANRRTRDSVSSNTQRWRSANCPFEYDLKRFEDTLPKFVAYATCKKCDSRCKPVNYTHKFLFKECHNSWLWGQRTLPVAFIWVGNNWACMLRSAKAERGTENSCVLVLKCQCCKIIFEMVWTLVRFNVMVLIVNEYLLRVDHLFHGDRENSKVNDCN